MSIPSDPIQPLPIPPTSPLPSIQKKSEKREASESSIEEMERIVSQLASDSFSPANFRLALKIENEMRETLAKGDFPDKEKYQEIYDTALLPFINKAKKLIKKSAHQFASQAAASKGKALQAGLNALVSRTTGKGQPAISVNTKSNHMVFLLPSEGAVLKKFRRRVGIAEDRSTEEERLANSLLDLMSPQASVGSFFIKKASLPEFGIQFSSAEKDRGHALNEMPDNLKTAVLKKVLHFFSVDGLKTLADAPKLFAEKYKSIPPTKKLENYQEVSKQKWSIKSPKTEKWEEISFKDLQNAYLSDKLPETAEIALSSDLDKGLSLEEHILKGGPLIQALNYIPALDPPSGQAYLTPNLSNPETRKNYELCEKLEWTYTDNKDKKHTVDFKTLHARWLLGEVREIAPSSSITPPNFRLVLDVQWKLLTPDLRGLEAVEKQPTKILDPLSYLQAKPFIQGMILMSSCSQAEKELFLKKLSPNAQFNAILTGEIALLDLHDGNLGLVPVPNAEYEYFSKYHYSTNLSSLDLSLDQLIKHYLSGKLTSSSIIEFTTENGRRIRKPLKDLFQLEKALNVPWELVLFDTDQCLPESSNLQFMTNKHGKKEHLIPLRSGLLCTAWKDTPLDEEAVRKLIEHADQDLSVRQWMKKEDSHIYRQLSTTAKQKLMPILERYNLTEARGKDHRITISDLQNLFSEDFSKINPTTTEIWKIIAEDLSSVVVLKDDTLESIAKRHHQKIEDLETLNPPKTLVPGEKIKIKYDVETLQSDTPQGQKRRKEIAKQLFPRLTVRQQTALIERQTRRKEYLEDYQTLKNLISDRTDVENTLKQIENMLKKPTTPLNSIEQEEFLKAFAKVTSSKSIEAVWKLAEKILKRFQPTYFNLMKVMFPLLADAYTLNALLYGESFAGKSVGYPLTTLESAIEDGLTRRASIAGLAHSLKDRLSSCKQTASRLR